MDFNDTPEEAAYRAEVRAWLDKNAVRKENLSAAAIMQGRGDVLKASREWQAKKADAGYACITWPKEWGGAGGTSVHNVIYSQEEAAYAVPGGVFAIGLGMCIPTLMAWGPEDAKQRYVKPAVRGEEIWCQLFSEPAGGSDVAGLRTRAERDGDDWIEPFITRLEKPSPLPLILTIRSPFRQVAPVSPLTGGRSGLPEGAPGSAPMFNEAGALPSSVHVSGLMQSCLCPLIGS